MLRVLKWHTSDLCIKEEDDGAALQLRIGNRYANYMQNSLWVYYCTSVFLQTLTSLVCQVSTWHHSYVRMSARNTKKSRIIPHITSMHIVIASKQLHLRFLEKSTELCETMCFCYTIGYCDCCSHATIGMYAVNANDCMKCL